MSDNANTPTFRGTPDQLRNALTEMLRSEKRHTERAILGAAIAALPDDDRVAKLVGALREARSDLEAYIDADWPEPQRAAYPPIQAKWKRDMELCWRIDAALAAWGAGK